MNPQRPQTPFEQAIGMILILIGIVFILGICINYNIQNAKSRDARDQYSEQSGCTWSGNDLSGYHMEC